MSARSKTRGHAAQRAFEALSIATLHSGVCVALMGCGAEQHPRATPEAPAQPVVSPASTCLWYDADGEFHRGGSPVASRPVRACERQIRMFQWDGCVHLDLARVACLNGCSECIAHVVGDESPAPMASRADQCWSEPEPGCAIAFQTELASTWGHLHRAPAPTYDCAMVDGVCTAVSFESASEAAVEP